MSKGPKTLTSTDQSTSTTTIDPTLKARQDALYNEALGLTNQPYQPYTGDRFAGFTPDQLAAFQQARDAAGAGQTELNAATTGAGLLGDFSAPTVGYQAPTMTAATGPTGYNASLINPLSFGATQVGGARDIMAKTGPAGYEAYMSPYLNDVVNTSLGDIERSRAEAANATRSQAAQAGAFGGSRSGVAEALSNREFARTAAATAAGLRQQGFNTALGFNAADQGRDLQAQAGNQAADLTRAGLGVQAGLGDRANLLQIAQANANATNDASRFGIATGADLAKFNTGQANTGALENARNALTADQTNASSAISGAGIRQSALALLSTLAGQRQAMGATGADLLSRVGGAQQGLDQANKDFAYQQFQEARQLPYQNLDLLSQILQRGQYGTTTTSSSTANKPNPNRGGLFSGILGLAGLIPGIGSAISGVGGLLGIGGTKWPTDGSAQ